VALAHPLTTFELVHGRVKFATQVSLVAEEAVRNFLRRNPLRLNIGFDLFDF